MSPDDDDDILCVCVSLLPAALYEQNLHGLELWPIGFQIVSLSTMNIINLVVPTNRARSSAEVMNLLANSS